MKVKWLTIVLAGVAGGAGFYLSLQMRTDFTTLDGESVSWQQLQGEVVVVNYFAQWCAPCLKEIPELNAFHSYTQDNPKVSLFAVNFDNLADQPLRELVEKYEMQFPMISGLPENAPYAMPKALPATFIIGKDGKLIKQLNGEQSKQSLVEIVERVQQLQGL